MARDTVTVPVEITLEMQKAYFDVIDKNMQRVQTDARFGRFESNREAYRAMIAAAPSSDPEGGARGVQTSIATKQESRPESAPRTETAVREALPFGIIDPKYAAFYTVARLTAWSYGYAIAMHGSFTRDLDLIAIPWTDAAVSPEELIHQIQYRTGCTPVKPNASIREHGRIVWTLSFPEFDCPRFVDFSIIPPVRLDTQLTKTPSADHDAGNLRGLAEPNHQPHAVSQGWRDIETAPRDGTRILIWFVHANAKYSSDPIAEGWEAAHEAYWIDHNGGGWTWHGLCGVATYWMPLPAPPSPAKTGGVG